MAALAPGVLIKLLDGMTAGSVNPVGEHRNALLQVTDIVPADLDEKDLLPKHGFYIKVSDSSQSIYAALPLDQNDLVLSNKIQLGQFIYVDRLKTGTPVPIMLGVKPLPGRHPFMGTPEPIVRGKRHGEKTDSKEGSYRKRGSWESEKKVTIGASSPWIVRPTSLDFDDNTTPLRTNSKLGKIGSLRSSVSGALLSKMAELKESGTNLMSKSFVLSKHQKGGNISVKDSKIVKSPLSIEKNLLSASCKVRVKRLGERHESKNEVNPLPTKLGLLHKEAMSNRVVAQKLALQALRDASAAETLVRVLKVFSDLSTTAKPDSPATIFDRYLQFHEEIIQAVVDMEKIQAATVTSMESEIENEDQTILHEISNNGSSTKRKVSDLRLNAGTRQIRATPKKTLVDKKTPADAMAADQQNALVLPPSSLCSSIRLAKEVRTEAGNWFMDFLDAALDSGMKKRGVEGKSSGKCPQSLLLKVINWVEVEQSGGSRRSPAHPRATFVARKLRIKAKNP